MAAFQPLGLHENRLEASLCDIARAICSILGLYWWYEQIAEPGLTTLECNDDKVPIIHRNRLGPLGILTIFLFSDSVVAHHVSLFNDVLIGAVSFFISN